MSDDYPFGADCDVDALVCNIAIPLRVRQAIAATVLKVGDLLKIDAASLSGIVESVIEYAEDMAWQEPEPETSPQCRGDGATGPGGGAPTSKEPQ